jgi:Cytochrome c
MYKLVIVSLVVVALMVVMFVFRPHSQQIKTPPAPPAPEWPWEAPDTAGIPRNATGDLIRYGRLLVSQTAGFLGPKGSVKPISNGLNCQNCHLDAGTKPWGNNYGGVASTYPKFRERSGMVESIEKKINDCFERSMNGMPLDSTSREMRAMVAYMQWLGTKVQKGKKPLGAGLGRLPYLDRAADPQRGKTVFVTHCQRCHGADGQGKPKGSGYEYPPLWGPHSYNTGAGIYRISKMAAFVKRNMPFDNPVLTDEEAWDVAAFVNTQPRPVKDTRHDWPDMKTKPVDHPFGPYVDTFSELQHKFGPFKPIEEY